MTTTDDISSQMQASLAVSDPDLDTSIGTTTRKILDAVAEAIAEAYVDQHLLSYQYDINSKTGSDLDTFTQLFGISRLAAKRATGYAVFSRPSGDLTGGVFIPVNTQVTTSDQTPITMITVASAIIQINQQSVIVPCQAASGGPTGNIAAGALTTIATPMQGVTAVTNIEAFTGGVDQETDTALRLRWTETVFRSLAGTEPMYLGIALDDPDCYAANVVGATSTYTEQVQIESGQAISSIDPDSLTFVYPRTSVVTNVSIPDTLTTADYNTSTDTEIQVESTDGFQSAGNLLLNGFQADYLGTSSTSFTGVTSSANTVITAGADVQQETDNSDILLRNYDYTFNTSVIPPKIESTGTGSRLSNGGIYTLSYEYVSSASRNIPTSSINNRIDVWCAGTRATDAQQSVVWNSDTVFNDGTGGDVGSPYFNGLYVRPDGSLPFVGNIFIPLGFGPILTLPENLSVGVGTFVLSTGLTGPVVDGAQQLSGDYQIVHRNDAFGWTPISLFGIEWNSTNLPVDNTIFTVGQGYTYNNIPTNVQLLIENWRLVGTDAQAHQAKQIFLQFNLAVMYTLGASQAQVNTQIGTNLSSFLQTIPFGGVLQISDALNVISSTSGVDNVRFLNATDYPDVYNPADPNITAVAIQQIVGTSVVNTYCDAVSGRAIDIVFEDDTVPVFNSIGGGGSMGLPSVRAQNTFGIN